MELNRNYLSIIVHGMWTRFLTYLKTLSPLSDLSLLQLSRKLVTLFALSTGQRAQTIHLFDVRNIECSEKCIKVRIGDPLKQTRPQKHLPELCVASYTADKNLCVVHTYKHYIDRTAELRLGTQLFIRTQKPHSWVSKVTISHWIKQVLTDAGIDMSIFSPHSTRSAACSAAATVVPIDTVLRTAGWSSENTFRKFYNRQVATDGKFGEAVLKHLSSD